MENTLKMCKLRLSQIYFVAVFTVMTFYMHDGYFDTLQAKSSIVMLGGYGYIVLMCMISILQAGFTKDYKFDFWRTYSRLDWSMVLFMIAAILATFFSVNVRDSFWGNDSLCMGACFLIIFVLVFLFLSKHLVVEKWMIYIVIVSGVIVFLWGLSDCMDMDVMNWHQNMASVHYDYLSTFGNRDWYVGYLSLVVPFFAALFLLENKKHDIGIYMIYLFFGFVSIYITKNNGNLLLFGCGIPLMYMGLKNTQIWNRVVLLLLIFASAGMFLHCLMRFVEPNHLVGDSVLGVLLEYHWYVGLFAIALIMFLLRGMIEKLRLEKLWIAFSGLVLVVLVICVCLCFDYQFGSDRGYVWMYSLSAYFDGTLIHKIFGCGVDCYKQFVYALEGELVASTWPEQNYVANAHNEWLQYLVTMGMVGLFTYGLVVFNALYNGCKQISRCCEANNSIQIAAGIGLCAYFCTSLGYNPQPLNYAVLVVMLAIVGQKNYDGLHK